ncbi:MAG: hypothetical protein FWH48_07460 [Oscillospiraceae bacterium]|nr:hypothetical protein [Oscillospiraceae bacterium]
MKTKTRRAMAFAMALTTIILAAALASSCTTSEAEQTIMVQMKITGSTEEICNMPLQVIGMPSELTVLAATRKMCVDVQEVEFDYDAEIQAVKRIGADISELFLDDYATTAPEIEEGEEAAPGEAEEGEEAAEDTTEENPEDIVKDYYYDWTCTINGVEAGPSDTIKDGDNIEWLWKQVKKELTE